MEKILFGKNNKHRTVIYRKSEVNNKIVRAFVDAEFNARKDTTEQNYLILLSELNDVNPNKNPYLNALGNGKTTDAYFVKFPYLYLCNLINFLSISVFALDFL